MTTATPAIAYRPCYAARDGALLERAEDLERIAESVEAAVDGRGSMMVIEGEAGIGKSALLARATTFAAGAGVEVIHARGWERERELAFGVVRQLFEQRLLGTGGADLLSGPAAFAAPALAQDPSAELGGGDPSAVLHGLFRLTARLAAEQPLVVAIDDAHWADDASVEFVGYLARRVAELPVLLVYCARPQAHVRTRLPHAVELELPYRVVRPTGLSAIAVGALVADELGEDAAAGLAGPCHAASRGNPFLVRELLRELRSNGMPVGAADPECVAQLAPQSIARSVLARLARLGEAETRLAMAVSVLGARAELRHAAALVGLEIVAAGDAADALVAASILEPRRPLEFVHPVVAATVYASIAPSRRAESHLRVAHLYAREATAPEMIGPHLLATEPAGDSWVVAELRHAATVALARGAPQTAWRYLDRAHREPPPPELRAPVLLELGIAATRLGDSAAAAHFAAAHDLAQDAATRTAAAVELARAMTYGGDLLGAVELLKVTLDRLEDEEPELARLVEDRLFLTAEMNCAAHALIADRIEAAGRQWRSGAHPPAPAVLSVLAIEAVAAGSARDAAELGQLALRDGLLVAELGADSPAVYFATCALGLADRIDVAQCGLDAAVAQARESGSRRSLATASCFRAFNRYRAGDVVGAEEDARAALDLADAPFLEVLRPVLVATLVDCLGRRGDVEGASALLDEIAIDDLDPHSVFTLLVRESAATLRIAQGRPADAMAHLAACEDWAVRWGVTNPGWITWRSTAALAHEACGRHERAIELADEEVRAARVFGGHRSCAIALRTAGLIGGGERGLGLLRVAVRHSASSGAQLVHAETLAALGGALRRQRRPREARAPLSHALELAHRCGATGVAEYIRAELVASGARPRRVALSGVESLTASECRVARLASEGLTNRAIAGALFVTSRTVETHLTHIYQKLDITSRRELAGTLAR